MRLVYRCSGEKAIYWQQRGFYGTERSAKLVELELQVLYALVFILGALVSGGRTLLALKVD